MILFAFTCFSSDASGADGSLLVDREDLLDVTEEEIILEELLKIQDKYQFDTVIVTTDSFEGKTASEFADDYFDNHGYGAGNNFDGIIFVVSLSQRQWAISTSGFGITAFTDYGLEYIDNEVISYLSDGNFYNGFMYFSDLVDQFVEQAKKGDPYDIDHEPKSPFSIIYVFWSLIIGIITAMIGTGISKGQLRSVRRQNAAAEYVRPGSFHLSEDRELYLYRKIDRVRKPDNNSNSSGRGSRGGSTVHVSSSGRSHGGRSGSF